MRSLPGFALVLTGGLTQPLMIEDFNWIGSGKIGGSRGIPVPLIIMLLAFLLIWWVMAFTPFGRFIYASGGNPEASRMLGIPVDRTQIALYIVSGISGALAGIIVAAMLGAAAPDCRRQAPSHGHRGNHPWRHLAVRRPRIRVGHAARRADPRHAQQRPDLAQRLELLAGRHTGVVLLLAVSLDQLRIRSQG